MLMHIWQYSGVKIAVGIISQSSEEIEADYNSFYNHQATDGQLHWLSENRFAYFFTFFNQLKQGLFNREWAKLINESWKYKGKKGGIYTLARLNAEKEFASWQQEFFLRKPTLIAPFKVALEWHEQSFTLEPNYAVARTKTK